VMLLDIRNYDFAMRGKGMQSRLFIVSHETAIAVYVGTEYGSKLALHNITRSTIIGRYL